jgi:hypothetical protein
MRERWRGSAEGEGERQETGGEVYFTAVILISTAHTAKSGESGQVEAGKEEEDSERDRREGERKKNPMRGVARWQLVVGKRMTQKEGGQRQQEYVLLI